MPRVWVVLSLLGGLLVGLAAVSAGGLIAQEPTPEGRLGGRAPLDATAPIGTLPPTATSTPAGSPAAGSPAAGSPAAGSPAAGSPVGGASSVRSSPPAASDPDGSVVPVPCRVAPRTLDDLGALLAAPEPPPAAPAPSADEWTPDARAEAEAVVAELVACGNAGEQLAAYALLTDRTLLAFLVGALPAEGLATIDAVFFGDAPPLTPALVTGLETRPEEPGVVSLWLDLGAGRTLTATLTVVREGGAWRISAIELAEQARLAP